MSHESSFSLSFLRTRIRLRKLGYRLYQLYQACLVRITRMAVCNIRLLLRFRLLSPRRFLHSPSFWFRWLRAALQIYCFYPRSQSQEFRPITASSLTGGLLAQCLQRQLQPVRELSSEGRFQLTGSRISNFTQWFNLLGRGLRGRFSHIQRRAPLNPPRASPLLQRISYALGFCSSYTIQL